MEFKAGDYVLHKKSGNLYKILMDRRANLRLEETGEAAYAYQADDGDGPVWVRCVRQMEDGRFELAEPPTPTREDAE